MPDKLTIQGIELTRRAAGKVGQLRAIAYLDTEYGVDLLGGSGFSEDDMKKLVLKPGGMIALLGCLFTGEVARIDEDDLDLSFLTGELLAFFGVSGPPSTGQPDGSHPLPPSESESSGRTEAQS